MHCTKVKLCKLTAIGYIVGMRLDWLDDILAVLDTGSFARAAETRNLTQSAFTRRIRTIEDSIGAELFDRTRKPVELLPAVRAQEPEMRALAAGLRRLRDTLRRSGQGTGRSIAFACQHAITTTVSPRLVAMLVGAGGWSVRVRSGNRDECLLKLLSGEVDFVVMYVLPGERGLPDGRGVESVTIGADPFIPVAAPAVQPVAGEWPIVAYPGDVFLGQVMDHAILPKVPPETRFARQAETALTLAAHEYALAGIGVAWLPAAMVGRDLREGRLISLEEQLPGQVLDIRMIRLAGPPSPTLDAAWKRLVENYPG